MGAVKTIKENKIVKRYYALGTIIQFIIFTENYRGALDKALDKIYDIENKMSVFKNFSEVSLINQNAGKKPVKVSEDTYFVIETAYEFSKMTNGAVDITVKPLVDLWKSYSAQSVYPSEKDILNTLEYVNYKHIGFYENNSIMLKKNNMSIDLGAIAKGYAADQIKKILISNGIEKAIIDLGGNVIFLGNKDENNKWKVGIQNPLQYRGTSIMGIYVDDTSVVTSGGYERYFEFENKYLPHIINPKTGKPVENDILSVTVISPSSIDADALSTALFVMDIEKTKEVISNWKYFDVVIIDKHKNIFITPNLTNKYELYDKNYQVSII